MRAAAIARRDCRSNSWDPIQTMDDFGDSVTSVVVHGCEIVAGSVDGTVRTFDKEVQKLVMQRMQEICDGMGPAYGVEAKLDYEVWYPATISASASPFKTAVQYWPSV